MSDDLSSEHTSERVPGGAPLDETLNLLGGCPAQHPDGHLCTLARGHAGDHEAHGVAVDRPPYRVWPNSITDGATLIAAERRRQVQTEGWTPDHDDEHDACELAQAAVAYVIHAVGETPGGWPEPFHRTVDLAASLGVPSDRSIYFAVALVAAEMARLLELYADGADSFETKTEAAEAIDSFRSLRRSALAELIANPDRSDRRNPS